MGRSRWRSPLAGGKDPGTADLPLETFLGGAAGIGGSAPPVSLHVPGPQQVPGLGQDRIPPPPPWSRRRRTHLPPGSLRPAAH